MKRIIFIIFIPLPILLGNQSGCFGVEKAKALVRDTYQGSTIVADVTDLREEQGKIIKAEPNFYIVYSKVDQRTGVTKFYDVHVCGMYSTDVGQVLSHTLVAVDPTSATDGSYRPIPDTINHHGKAFIRGRYIDVVFLAESYVSIFVKYVIKTHASEPSGNQHIFNVTLRMTLLTNGTGCAGCFNEIYDYAVVKEEMIF